MIPADRDRLIAGVVSPESVRLFMSVLLVLVGLVLLIVVGPGGPWLVARKEPLEILGKLLTAVAIAVMHFAGCPQITYYNLLLGSLYALLLALRRGTPRDRARPLVYRTRTGERVESVELEDGDRKSVV